MQADHCCAFSYSLSHCLHLRLQEAVLFAAKLIHESCTNLLQQLEGLAAEHGLLDDDSSAGITDSAAVAAANASSSTAGEATAEAAVVSSAAAEPQAAAGARFREALVARIRQEGVISWLVPPMLQGSTTDLGGWV
jgi:hypothetical protein